MCAIMQITQRKFLGVHTSAMPQWDCLHWYWGLSQQWFQNVPAFLSTSFSCRITLTHSSPIQQVRVKQTRFLSSCMFVFYVQATEELVETLTKASFCQKSHEHQQGCKRHGLPSIQQMWWDFCKPAGKCCRRITWRGFLLLRRLKLM